jgi:hypothetical protein
MWGRLGGHASKLWPRPLDLIRREPNAVSGFYGCTIGRHTLVTAPAPREPDG